jgi:hypothetical protein
VRRTLIQFFLPLVFATLPLLAAALVVATLPTQARAFYFEKLTNLDYVILALGLSLFGVQTLLAYSSMVWTGDGFNERPDPWLTRLAQSSEWFPLLGLIGTVGGILQTFSSIDGPTPQAVIIQKYAPAITATGSGLFMALLNILPSWVVLVGRGLILTLGGRSERTEKARSMTGGPPS